MQVSRPLLQQPDSRMIRLVVAIAHPANFGCVDSKPVDEGSMVSSGSVRNRNPRHPEEYHDVGPGRGASFMCPLAADFRMVAIRGGGNPRVIGPQGIPDDFPKMSPEAGVLAFIIQKTTPP